MPQAILPLLMNLLIAIMFVAGFMAVAHAHPVVSKARWFALCFLLGLADPLANLAVWFGVNPDAMRLLGFTLFLAAMLGLALALSHFHDRKPFWKVAIAILAGGFLYRLFTLDAPRDATWNLLLFQSWYAMAAALCAYAVRRHARPSPINTMLFVLFLVLTVHFPIKALFAAHLGSGRTEGEYANTLYAVISQTTSGVLMVAAGLLIIINFLQSVVQNTQAQALSDPLTGLPNRRAMDRWFDELAAAEADEPAVVAVIDIDHFKTFNDRFGHDVGDKVLRAVATCLDRHRPSAARLARLGGEEFVLLLLKDEAEALLTCESMRLAISRLTFAETDPVTVSIGLASALPGEAMGGPLRRADQALYRAKGLGRNRCEVALAVDGQAPSPPPSGAPDLKLVAKS